MPTTSSSRARKVMPLTGSLQHARLRLSFQAVAATHLAVHLLARSSPMRPTLSAVTRRALLLYTTRLEQMTPDDRISEARSVLFASKAMLPADREDMERTLAGLEALGEADHLPTLSEVLHGPSGPLDVAALDARVSQHLKTMFPRKFRDG